MRITTNLVQVDAVITDKQGRVVTDLKPEELEIYEDGRKQKITNFQYYVAEGSAGEAPIKPTADKSESKNNPPLPPTRLRREDVRRTIALVVDDLGLSFQSAYYARRALKKFVDEQMQPGDLVAIIRTSGGMGALQQFTSDKRQLYAAVERVKWNGLGRGGIAAFAPLEGAGPKFPEGKDDQAPRADVEQFREEVFSVGTLGALSYVVRGLRELPGRKSVLLISDGLRIFNREDPTRASRVLAALQRLTDQANRASVVIYTMDARGLQTLGLTAADNTAGMSTDQIAEQLSNRSVDFFESQNGLNYLAQQTGGLAIRNTNDLSGGIKSVLEDQRGYYLIGYRPDESTFDPRTGRRKFHKLSLKVTRAGKFSVRMRNGFFGVSDEEKEPQRRTLAQQLVSALVSPFGATGVHLQLTSLFANDPKVGSFMRSILYVDPKDLTFTDEPNHMHKCVFDVLAMTFGDNGVPVDQSGKTYTITINDEWYQRIQRDGLVYYITVPIKKPGAYQLRTSLRDSASDRIGSASQFVDVPDLKKDRLALSSLSLVGKYPAERSTKMGAAANQSASPHDSSAATPDEGLEKGNAEASAAVRHLSRGMTLEYAFIVYNARADKTTNRPHITTQVKLFRNGKEVFTGRAFQMDPASQTDMKRLGALGRIQLGTDLVPGEYVLQVIVTDALADEKHRVVTQWMDFEIVR